MSAVAVEAAGGGARLGAGAAVGSSGFGLGDGLGDTDVMAAPATDPAAATSFDGDTEEAGSPATTGAIGVGVRDSGVSVGVGVAGEAGETDGAVAANAVAVPAAGRGIRGRASAVENRSAADRVRTYPAA